MEDITNKYNKLKSIFIKRLSMLKGMTSQAIKLKNNVLIGAKMNKNKFVLYGNINSFSINFRPSARGCKTPLMPVILGPLRRCIEPIIFLSANVKKAIDINKGTSKRVV
jgi:hypothetical protein